MARPRDVCTRCGLPARWCGWSWVHFEHFSSNCGAVLGYPHTSVRATCGFFRTAEGCSFPSLVEEAHLEGDQGFPGRRHVGGQERPLRRSRLSISCIWAFILGQLMRCMILVLHAHAKYSERVHELSGVRLICHCRGNGAIAQQSSSAELHLMSRGREERSDSEEAEPDGLRRTRRPMNI